MTGAPAAFDALLDDADGLVNFGLDVDFDEFTDAAAPLLSGAGRDCFLFSNDSVAVMGVRKPAHPKFQHVFVKRLADAPVSETVRYVTAIVPWLVSEAGARRIVVIVRSDDEGGVILAQQPGAHEIGNRHGLRLIEMGMVAA